MMNDDLKLDGFFSEYRAACPEIEPGPNFMPNVWHKIEARHGFLFIFGRLARTGTAAAAVLCLLLLILNITASPVRLVAPTYADALAADNTIDNPADSSLELASSGDFAQPASKPHRMSGE